MSVVLQLTPRDPLIARDGRPFGAGQGHRMRGLPWPLPSVVAGSFRTALVKAGTKLDFSGDVPQRLLQVAVAGAFPVHDGELYLPAPNDAVAEPVGSGKGIKTIHRVAPQPTNEGCDFPDSLPLQPAMLPAAVDDFKPVEIPNWWPVKSLTEWMHTSKLQLHADWFDSRFLKAAHQEMRDHVCLDAERGSAAEGQIFATSGLNVSHLPRFGADTQQPWSERLAPVTLSARVTIPDSESSLNLGDEFDIWHPLGGERRLVHWKRQPTDVSGWSCPNELRAALATAKRIRMVLATPAIFTQGWKPGWLTNGVSGVLRRVELKLVGVSSGRWKAVSGWSLAKINARGHLDPAGKSGPKAIRRMVPAGSVYFFEVEQPGAAAPLADQWLQSVSDQEQEQRDGFGLAVWGTW